MTGSDLQRFVTAQDAHGTFTGALAELAAGRKVTHWMWFVFPQLAGLGRSDAARLYALASRDEAVDYLAHPVLGARIHQAAQAALEAPATDAVDLLGAVDAVKLRSSMTLFHRAAPDDPLFASVLERYFDGAPDEGTDRLLGPDR